LLSIISTTITRAGLFIATCPPQRSSATRSRSERGRGLKLDRLRAVGQKTEFDVDSGRDLNSFACRASRIQNTARLDLLGRNQWRVIEVESRFIGTPKETGRHFWKLVKGNWE